MNIFDMGTALLSAFFLARGIWVGVIRQLAFIVALFLGFLVAARFHAVAYPVVSGLVTSKNAAFFLTYIALFVVVYLATMLTGLVLRNVVQFSLLGWLDRLLGGVLGTTKAVMIASIIFMALSSLPPAYSKLPREAYLYPYLLPVSQFLLKAVSDPKLREDLLPKDPNLLERFLPDILKKQGEADWEGLKDIHKKNTMPERTTSQ